MATALRLIMHESWQRSWKLPCEVVSYETSWLHLEVEKGKRLWRHHNGHLDISWIYHRACVNAYVCMETNQQIVHNIRLPCFVDFRVFTTMPAF